MSEQGPDAAAGQDDGIADQPSVESPAEYGGLTVEDSEAETVDPADVAGTADSADAPVTYAPEHSEADTE
jgi:hypothetical protein